MQYVILYSHEFLWNTVWWPIWKSILLHAHNGNGLIGQETHMDTRVSVRLRQCGSLNKGDDADSQ